MLSPTEDSPGGCFWQRIDASPGQDLGGHDDYPVNGLNGPVAYPAFSPKLAWGLSLMRAFNMFSEIAQMRRQAAFKTTEWNSAPIHSWKVAKSLSTGH